MSTLVSREGLGKIDCAVCSKLREDFPENYGYNVTHVMLREAAASGCEVCNVLEEVSEVAHGHHLVNDDAIVSVRAPDDRDPAFLSIWWDYRPSTGAGEYFHKVLYHVIPGE
jgi:hypothetical protein